MALRIRQPQIRLPVAAPSAEAIVRMVPGALPAYLHETSAYQRLTTAGYVNEQAGAVSIMPTSLARRQSSSARLEI